jgi:hypothetical protein
VGSTLALAHPLYYDRLVQLASTIFGTIIWKSMVRGWRPTGSLAFKVLGENLFLPELSTSGIKSESWKEGCGFLEDNFFQLLNIWNHRPL